VDVDLWVGGARGGRRALERRVLAGYLGCAPDAVVIDRHCGLCGDPEHGKPRVPGGTVGFSASSAGDVTVVAVSRDGELGVDVADPRALADILGGELPPGLLSAGEALWVAAAGDRTSALGRLWVRKEALAKAIGTGLVADAEALDTTADPLPGGWALHDLDDVRGYRAALATAEPLGTLAVRDV
jgi:4'-phosphopantetheinyl transferase